MKKVFLKYWPILVILILSGLIVWPLFLPGYFSHHDDLQVMRIFEMRRCLQDLQIPCRWVPDMGYGNGYPLFNYYNPFPYYIGGILSFLFGYLISAKILFFIPLVLGGISMYLLAKEVFNKEAGFVASILYIFAPYRALDSYVRGAVAESFAISLVPLVLYLALKLIKENSKRNLAFFSVTLAAFLTSHTIMSLLFAPVLLFMIIYWIWTEKKGLYVILGLFLGFGLSAFFVLPAYFEKDLVQIDNLTRLDLDFRAHFVTLPQLFLDRSWGYGASLLGSADTISFQVGWPHWMVAFASIPLVIILKRKDKQFLVFYLGIFLIFALSVFMTHNKSAFIWEEIGVLRFTQFPWRFLSVTIFATAMLSAFLIYPLKGFLTRVLIVMLVLASIVLNWNYFRPKEFYFGMTDKTKLSGIEWDTQQKAAILDYLPVGASEPSEPAPDKPIIRVGEADIQSFEKRSNSFRLDINVKSTARIEIPMMDFPNWNVYENGKEIKHTNDNYVKRISISLPAGIHSISGKLTDTPIRVISNIVSLLSLAAIGYLTLYEKSKKYFK
ncbi:glycosyltransferase family 39 protein [Candidatus Daviesbacteria bacterium]|nr:glycosyltransferase family 39 protein [Candidatus Daviesbacteria bacterium]